MLTTKTIFTHLKRHGWNVTVEDAETLKSLLYGFGRIDYEHFAQHPSAAISFGYRDIDAFPTKEQFDYLKMATS